MMTNRSLDVGPPEPAQSRWLAAAAALLIIGFVVAFSARPPIVLSFAQIDDALFMRLGMHLASGRWLGQYDVLTLTKGPGFPAFLAIANVLGLPYPLALALFHAGCAAFAAAVFGRASGSRALGFAVLAALLLTPTFYDGDLLGVFRDFFYMSLCVAFVAAAVALATGCLGRPGPMAALTGLLGAWVWLTREEGVWLLPCLALLLLIPLLRLGPAPARARDDLVGRVRALGPSALALVTATALVCAVGLVNLAVYGRFVVNEIKDPAFQGAMRALQDASWPFHREGIPVPAAARARIYAASPTFASIKQPILDGPMQADATQYGCRENPKFCGDFAGGWFFWDLRNSVALKGWHESPAKAAVFYTRLAHEVRAACADGRLDCGRWPVPLVPPMTVGELPDVAASFRKIFHVFTFGEPVLLQGRASDLTAPDAEAMVAFLNAPAVHVPSSVRHLNGWFVGQGSQWFAPVAGDGVKVLGFTRVASPDLVPHFHDPRLAQQRFTLDVQCPAQATCPLTLALDGGGAVPLDLAALAAGAHPAGGGTLWLDSVGGSSAEALLKTRFSHAWLSGAARLLPLFRALVFVGAAAWLALLAEALVRRRISLGLVVATALLATVVARMVLLSLIDALSFAAATHSYSLAGIALLVLFAVLSIHEAAALVTRRRREGALEPETVAEAPVQRRAAS